MVIARGEVTIAELFDGYTWVKYADTPTSGMSNFPDGKKYIGMAFNKTTETESNNYSDYQWSLMPQNIEIGGRNLLKGTSFSGILDSSYWWGQQGYTVSIDDTEVYKNFNSLRVDATAVGEAGSVRLNFKALIEPELNTEYVFSFYAKALEDTTLTARWGYGSGSSSVNITTDWHKYEMVVKTGNQMYMQILPYYDKITTLWIALPKLEKGTKATDWTPAPEDVDEAIQAVDTKYSNKVAEIDTTIDSITQRVSSTETNITTINGTVAAHNTRIESAESKITPSAIVQTVRSSTAYTSDLSGKVDTTQFESYRLQTAQLIEDRVEKDGVIAAISLSPETAKIQANKIELEGLVTANSNFKILADGSIETKNADISGKITATSGNIGGWAIGNGFLDHSSTGRRLRFSAIDNYSIYAGTDGQNWNFLLNKNGTLQAKNADISGKITATSGTIGNWIINYNNNGALTGTGSDGSHFTIAPPNSSYAYLLNVLDSTGTMKARITKEGKFYAREAEITGSISSSTITSSTITGTTITGGTVRTSSSGNRIQLSDNLLRAYESGTQRVRLDTSTLRFYNSDGTYTGSILASSGLLSINASDMIWCSQNTAVRGWLRPDVNNTYDSGSANYRWRTIYLQNNPNVASDTRIKANVQNIPNELIGELKGIQPKMYQQGEKWHFGYVAQDVERALYKYALKKVGWDKAKDYVREFEMLYKDESYLSLVYAEIAVLKEAEMQARIDELEARLLALEQALNDLINTKIQEV